MFSLPCDTEGMAALSPAARCRPQTLSLSTTPGNGSDTGSETTAASASGGGLGSDGWSLSSPPESAPPSPAPKVPPGLAVPEDFLSAGSMMHATGECKPCGWFWKLRGCHNGQACGYCHVCPPGAVKDRKKAKAAAAKAESSMLVPPLCDAAHQQTLVSPRSQAAPLSLVSLLSFEESLPLARVEVFPSLPMSAPPPPLYAPQLTLPQCLPPPPLNLALMAPPCQSPRLMLPRLLPLPPALSPRFALSPGALPRSLAMACMDEDADADGCPADVLQTNAPDCEESADAWSLECGPSSPPATPKQLQCSRVTLELSRVLPTSLPSQGSALHFEGRCTACAWFWKPQGCGNGQECSYCHLCPQGELRRRRKFKNAVLRAKSATETEALISMQQTSATAVASMVWPQLEISLLLP